MQVNITAERNTDADAPVSNANNQSETKMKTALVNFDFFKKACLREGMFKLVEKMPVIKDRDDEEEITAQKDESTVFTNMAQVLKHVENTENKHDAVKKLFKKMRQ